MAKKYLYQFYPWIAYSNFFAAMKHQQGVAAYIGSPEHRLAQLTSRVETLEETVFKKRKRKQTTEAQRFLLFYYLGGMKFILEIPTSQNMKDLYVAEMLDIDPDNVRKFRSELGKKNKPLLETVSNYTFLVEFFGKIKDRKNEAEAAKILLRLNNEKEKQAKKFWKIG